MNDSQPGVPGGYHSLNPYLIVDDGAAALAFFAEAFGGRETMRHLDGEGRVMHAEMAIGDSLIMICGENPAMNALGPKTLGGTPLHLAMYVPDVDAVFARAVAAGATPMGEVTVRLGDAFDLKDELRIRRVLVVRCPEDRRLDETRPTAELAAVRGAEIIFPSIRELVRDLERDIVPIRKIALQDATSDRPRPNRLSAPSPLRHGVMDLLGSVERAERAGVRIRAHEPTVSVLRFTRQVAAAEEHGNELEVAQRRRNVRRFAQVELHDRQHRTVGVDGLRFVGQAQDHAPEPRYRRIRRWRILQDLDQRCRPREPFLKAFDRDLAAHESTRYSFAAAASSTNQRSSPWCGLTSWAG